MSPLKNNKLLPAKSLSLVHTIKNKGIWFSDTRSGPKSAGRARPYWWSPSKGLPRSCSYYYPDFVSWIECQKWFQLSPHIFFAYYFRYRWCDHSWFLANFFSNFVSLAWKLHNRYCHKVGQFMKNPSALYQQDDEIDGIVLNAMKLQVESEK